MVKYSDDTEYEMIELANLFDLDKARIVQAQINSIDSANNCANITFSSECAELSGLSVDAVKFFYHCENSTGTEEDLADGHKAFKANEYVYCLWCPASPTIDERFFIIGHVDIRGTKRCAVGDYIIMAMGLNYEFGPHATSIEDERYVTIFDAAMMQPLDLDSFAELEGSPPKPAGFPCLLDSVFTAWVGYNFEAVVPPHDCPLYHDTYNASISVTASDNWPSPEYSGCTLHWSVDYSDGGGEDNLAVVDWTNQVGSYYTVIDATRDNLLNIPATRSGVVFTDGVTLQTRYACIGGEREIHAQGHGESGQTDVTASMDYRHVVKYRSTFDNIEVEKEVLDVTVPMGTGFSAVRYQKLHFASPYVAKVVGEYGLYVLIGGSESYFSMDIATENYPGNMLVTDTCDENVSFAYILLYPWEHVSVDYRPAVHTRGLSYCMASLFEDVEGDLPYTLSPIRCLEVMNHPLSRAMEECFAPLKTMIFNLTNDTRTYGAWAWEEPTLNVIKKRAVPV